VYNVEIWMANTLNYQVMASCSAAGAPPCPRPAGHTGAGGTGAGGAGNGSCSGKGTCSALVAASSTPDRTYTSSLGYCSCDTGFGDVGCDKTLTPLNPGAELLGSIAVGEWSYYEFEVKAVAGAAAGEAPVSMLVELNRQGGDPVLFVKRVDDVAGVRGGVPSVSDYDNFADTEGFRSRVNYHYRLLEDALPGQYYIAVFNNDVYIQDQAHFTVSARVSAPSYRGLPAGEPLCAANCSSPQGSCAVDAGGGDSQGLAITGSGRVGVCQCGAGFGGRMCEGTLAEVDLGQATMGTLAPGAWAYINFTADANIAKQAGGPFRTCTRLMELACSHELSPRVVC
jgi:hypothetical protein